MPIQRCQKPQFFFFFIFLYLLYFLIWKTPKRQLFFLVLKHSIKNRTVGYFILFFFIFIFYHYHHVEPSALISDPLSPPLPSIHCFRQVFRATSRIDRDAVCRFELIVLPLRVHVKESAGVHHLWSRPYFSSSVQHVWFV